MEELYEQGLIKAIGVANFMPDRLVDLICNNKILPAIDQVEVNPFCQRQIDEIMMKEKNVQMQSWGSFAEGRNNIFQNFGCISMCLKHFITTFLFDSEKLISI